MSQKSCADIFGTRVAQALYCIQLTIGNNSGYPLKVSRIGFSTQLGDASKPPPPKLPPPITIANNSYRSTRAILLKENVTNGRNIAYNVLQGAGVLMTAFTPYFGTGKHPNGTFNNARTNWTTAASIVSGPLLSAFNIVAPNPVITQLNSLDDESFRDGQIIASNDQSPPVVVFVEKQMLTYQLAALKTLYPNLANYNGANDPQVPKHYATMESTKENSANSRKTVSLKRGGFSPYLVELALGNVVIVGQQIQYLQRVQIIAAPPPGPLVATPSSLSFTSGANGVTSGASQPITLTNNGTTPVTGITPAIAPGANSSDFAVVPPLNAADACPSSLAPSGKCTISVTYGPPSTAVGAGSARTANLQISYGSGAILPLMLTGAASNTVYFSTTALSFAAATNAKPTTANLTITNFNGNSITITPSLALATAITGPDHTMFSAGATCDGPLNNNTSCTVTVTFTPPAGAAAGAYTATLTVSGTASGAVVLTQTVSLTGTV